MVVDPVRIKREMVGFDDQIVAVKPAARDTVLKQFSRQRLRTGSVHPDGARDVPRIARMLHDEPARIGGDEIASPNMDGKSTCAQSAWVGDAS